MAGGTWKAQYDAGLVEEAVAFALHARPRSPYWRERSKVYDLEDEERRASEFSRLARREFEALALGEPVDHALRERPILARAIGSCLVVPAICARDEGAELFVARGKSQDAARSMLIRLRAASFAAPEALLALLRHELHHIADMVDPAFGYDPDIQEPEDEPTRVKLLASRYGVLWDTAIDGHLAREGRAPAGARAVRKREFAAAFRLEGAALERAFGRWFEGPAPTHGDLVAFARSFVGTTA